MADEERLSVISLAEQARARMPRHTYTVPEASRELASDPKTITLRQLTYGEEVAAYAAAKTGSTVAHEMAKRSLIAVDGRTLSWANNEVENTFEGFSQKVRELVMTGYQRAALPRENERDAFLSSEKIEIP